jgi:lipopolysaccharide export system protein LptA
MRGARPRPAGRGHRLLALVALVLALAPAEPARAELADQLGSGGSSDQPVAIDAEQGIEWRRDEKVYIARGNVRAVRGEMAVYADVLTAYYREKEDGSTEIWRLAADGNVRMTSKTETLFGDRATYDMDKGVVTVTGKGLRLETPKEIITSRDSMEYWDKEQIVVARGDAQVVQGEKRVKADTLTGHLVKAPDGSSKLSTVEADGNVRIATKTEYARSNQAVYDLDTELAILTGAVKVTRGKNQLNGDRAEVNMKTGVSRLLASAGERVHTLITPSDMPREDETKPGAAKPGETKSEAAPSEEIKPEEPKPEQAKP